MQENTECETTGLRDNETMEPQEYKTAGAQANGAEGGGQIFAKATAFGKALTGNGASKEEDIYLWEHGVAVEPWGEPVDGRALLDALELLIKRFVVLGRWAAETLALWVIHTYAFQLREVATYVGIESPEKRCGKTTLLTVLCELVNRPVVASNISSPAFFRVIEEKAPTLMIDEADTVLHRNKELRGILNSGYAKKTAYVVRVAYQSAEGSPLRGEGNGTGAGGVRNDGGESERGEPGQGTKLARFSSWCPKAIALIKHLPETLADRCIVLQMQRKTWREKCERLRNLRGGDLRRKCARFVLDHAEAIAKAQPEIPEELNDRAADIWEPLLAVADLAGGDWPARARAAALGLTAATQEASPIGALLLDIMIMFTRQECDEANQWMQTNGGIRMFSRDMVAWLNGYEDRPWMVLRRGKEVNERWLSQQLSGYGVRPRTIWIGDRSAKGYMLEDFTETFRRYIPKAAAQAFIEEQDDLLRRKQEAAAAIRPEEKGSRKANGAQA